MSYSLISESDEEQFEEDEIFSIISEENWPSEDNLSNISEERFSEFSDDILSNVSEESLVSVSEELYSDVSASQELYSDVSASQELYSDISNEDLSDFDESRSAAARSNDQRGLGNNRNDHDDQRVRDPGNDHDAQRVRDPGPLAHLSDNGGAVHNNDFSSDEEDFLERVPDFPPPDKDAIRLPNTFDNRVVYEDPESGMKIILRKTVLRRDKIFAFHDMHYVFIFKFPKKTSERPLFLDVGGKEINY